MNDSSLPCKYPYAVGIPTKDRDTMLSKCIEALSKQTVKPDVVVIVNNNMGNRPIKLPKYDVPVVILDNKEYANGMMEGNRIALDWIIEHDYKIAAKWDDDLIPEPDCFEQLLKWIDKYNVVGGCYPRPESEVWKDGPRSNTSPPDKIKSHFQFFRWFEKNQQPPLPMEVTALYSSYIYSVQRMIEIGGYKYNLSPIAFREDTQISYDLGKCLIVPAAIAIHYPSVGGIRSFSNKILSAMKLHDNIIFLRRLEEMNLNFEDFFVVKELGK